MKIVQLDERRKSNLATISITEDTMNFQTRKIFVLKNKTKQQQKKKNLFPFVLSALPLRDGRERAALLNIHTKRKRKKRQKLRIPPLPSRPKNKKDGLLLSTQPMRSNLSSWLMTLWVYYTTFFAPRFLNESKKE